MVKIFVGNCSDAATNNDLRSLFSRYGKVVEADIINGKGYGFVHMESQNSADEAVAALDGLEFKGRKVRVELSNTRGQRSGGGGGPIRNNRNSREMGSIGGGRSLTRDFPSRSGGYSGGGIGANRESSRSLPYDEPYHRPTDPYESKSSSYRDPAPSSSLYSRDRGGYDSRGAPPPAPERYRAYDPYGRRPLPTPTTNSYYSRGRSPPVIQQQRNRSSLPSQSRARSPPRSYGMSVGSRYPDDSYETRRVASMSRGRSPPPNRGAAMRAMV